MKYKVSFPELTKDQSHFLKKAMELDARNSAPNTTLRALSISNALGWDYDPTSLALILVGLAQHGKVWRIAGEVANLSFRLTAYR